MIQALNRSDRYTRQNFRRRAKRFLRSAFIVLLCLIHTACSSILGDGEVTIVTAPPIVSPRVIVTDSYGTGEKGRFDIGGTDAFYLLPGVENNPDNLQDFNCLDYTDSGYFVYYYCGPAYINVDELVAYKGKSDTVPEDYVIEDVNRESGVTCDAMVVLAYNPDTRHYVVMDVQAYTGEGASDADRTKEMNTGVDFYKSQAYGFYTLSHCYGCKLSGMHRYYIFDQNGDATIYGQDLKAITRMPIGSLVQNKIKETSYAVNQKLKEDFNNKKAGKAGSSSSSGIITDDDFDSDDGGDERKEALDELSAVTGNTYDSGEQTGEEYVDVTLNGLVKSAVMDGSGIMYLTLLMYTGETPWGSDVMLNRVIQIYSFDLGGDFIHFVSRNEHWEEQVEFYKEKWLMDEGIILADIKHGIYGAEFADQFTPFDSDLEAFKAFIAGYEDLYANGGRGFRALADSAANNGENSNLAVVALANQVVKLYERAGYSLTSRNVLSWVLHPYKVLKPIVMSFSGFTSEDLDRVYDFLTWAGALSRMDDADISVLALRMTSKSQEEILKFLKDTYYVTDNLSNVIGSSGRLVNVGDAWKQLPSQAKTMLRQSLLGFINSAAENYYQRSQINQAAYAGRWVDYINLLDRYILSIFGLRISNIQGSSAKMTWDDYRNFLSELELLPRMGRYDPETMLNTTNFPSSADEKKEQAFILVHGTSTEFTDVASVPHASAVYLPDNTVVWLEPYEWNEEIKVQRVFIPQSAPIEAPQKPGPAPEFTDLSGAGLEVPDVITDPGGNQYYLQSGGSFSALQQPDIFADPNSNDIAIEGPIISIGTPQDSSGNTQPGEGETPDGEGGGGTTPETEPDPTPPPEPVIEEKVLLEAGKVPISYRLVFPKGTNVEFVDMENTDGSSNSSITSGALLFADDATSTKEGIVYTSSIFWQRETGVSFRDSKIPGAAIDTGALEYTDKNGRKLILLMITEEGVKFYAPTSASGTTYSGTGSSTYYMTNEELLSSTGFTPYTESGTQAAVSARMEGAALPSEKYDTDNSLSVTEMQVATALNSSRVGTLQAATSFTVISDSEVLISAYDSGLSLLRLNETHDVLHLQGGSYYQSFQVKNTGTYKIVGFDTEDYLYGSMDLARAKVYDLEIGSRKQEIYLTALQNHLDQFAVDYVRRKNRTRVQITEDEEGNIIDQQVVIIPFTDDHSTEAMQEYILFADSWEKALAELIRMEEAASIEHSQAAENYLRDIRKRVADQQAALNEVFILTNATVLGDALKQDPYWVGLKERLQATTEVGNLKDLLVEIVISDEMLEIMQKDAENEADDDLRALKMADFETYTEFRKYLDYKKQEEEQNKVLSEVSISAAELDSLLENRETPADYEERYDGAVREDAGEPDPLLASLESDVITAKLTTKEEITDRMESRALILEDIENDYFMANPLEPRKVFAPDGSYEEIVTVDRENVAWEAYLSDLLYRINPDNLSAARSVAVEEFAELSWSTARTMANGVISSNPMEVDEATREAMEKAIIDEIEWCETIYQVEALFYGTQIKNLGSPYNRFYDSFTEWENKSFATEAEKAKDMRVSEWYQALSGYLKTNPSVRTMLSAKGQTWEEYIQAVVTHKTGRVLRDEQTGEAAGGYTTAASVFAQLVEFLCENAGEVSLQTKINLVEDLLIGMLDVNGAEAAEEAVLIERMTLPAFAGYMPDYEAFSGKTFEEGSLDETLQLSYASSLRRQALEEEDFYIQVIGSMKDSALVKSYLAERGVTWDQYMASLPILAKNENITDPAASARKVYETFVPYVPLTGEDRPAASDGQEERPGFSDVTGSTSGTGEESPADGSTPADESSQGAGEDN